MIWILRCPSPALHKSMPSRHSSQNCNSKKNTKGTYMVGAISTRYSYKASRNFRLIPAKDYLREFASDRSHMVRIATLEFSDMHFLTHKSLLMVHMHLLLHHIHQLKQKVSKQDNENDSARKSTKNSIIRLQNEPV